MTRGVPVPDEETALSAAQSAIESRYGHVLDAAYNAYVEDSLAELFGMDTGSAVVIFTKETEGVAQGDTYWAALDWYSEALDVGCNLNPLDSVRFTMLMDGYLPSSYNEACLTTMKAVLAERMAEESAAAKLAEDGMTALADALDTRVCYDWQMLLLRDGEEVIWHFLLSTDVGCYAVDVRDSDLNSAGTAKMTTIGAPWALQLLTVRAWNELTEDVREGTMTLGTCSYAPGIIYGMQVKYIVSRYVRLYGANMQDWEPAKLLLRLGAQRRGVNVHLLRRQLAHHPQAQLVPFRALGHVDDERARQRFAGLSVHLRRSPTASLRGFGTHVPYRFCFHGSYLFTTQN